MTTLAAPLLTETQQALIDARLDTIDRMLMGRVPRTDRMEIVREVESQIQELLAERHTAEVSRDDILEVLRRLDPPEAYLPEESEAEGHSRAPRFVNVSSSPAAKTQLTGFKYGRLGGILGLCSFGMIFLFPVLYIFVAMLESEILQIIGLPAMTFLGTASSITGLVLSIRGRREGVLPILGIISSSLTLPMFLLAFGYTILLVLSML